MSLLIGVALLPRKAVIIRNEIMLELKKSCESIISGCRESSEEHIEQEQSCGEWHP